MQTDSETHSQKVKCHCGHHKKTDKSFNWISCFFPNWESLLYTKNVTAFGARNTV